MEDKIDKLYDLMEKMYIDLKGDIAEVKTDTNSLKDDVKGLKEEQRKLQLTQEQMQTKLEVIAEIQQSHYDENNRDHKEMLDRLQRIETATLENESEIYNIKKVK